jgi:hypothetical protein
MYLFLACLGYVLHFQVALAYASIQSPECRMVSETIINDRNDCISNLTAGYSPFSIPLTAVSLNIPQDQLLGYSECSCTRSQWELALKQVDYCGESMMSVVSRFQTLCTVAMIPFNENTGPDPSRLISKFILNVKRDNNSTASNSTSTSSTSNSDTTSTTSSTSTTTTSTNTTANATTNSTSSSNSTSTRRPPATARPSG